MLDGIDVIDGIIKLTEVLLIYVSLHNFNFFLLTFDCVLQR